MSEFLEWRLPPGALHGNGTLLPELWTRWEYFDQPNTKVRGAEALQPRKHGPPQRVPLVHWQGWCKSAGVTHVKEQFVDRGLIPDLPTPAV